LAVGLGLGLTIWRGIAPLLAEPKVTVNYVAEFNAEIAKIPEAERAWPLYVEAYGAIPEWPEGAGDMQRPARAIVDEPLRDWVERHAAAAEIAREAAQREHIGMTLSDAVSLEMGRAAAARQGRPLPTGFQRPSEQPMILDVLLPQLGAARAMAR